MLYTRNTIEYRDSTLAAIVPAAVRIDGRVDDFRDRHDRLAAGRASTTSSRIRSPPAILPRGIRVSPACISMATWHTAHGDRHRAPMRARY